jgi:hypothetical protein
MDWISPLRGEALLRSMRVYGMLGLPGCVGSIDGVFIPWERGSASLHNVLEGDKGLGVIFQVIVTHTKEVLYVSQGFYSTMNDKTAVKYVSFIQDLQTHRMYGDVIYKLRTGPADDDFVECSQCYVICDGGYLEWPSTMCGFPPSGNRIKYKFSDWIASVRKDVECFFGILKGRWRYAVASMLIMIDAV